MELIKFQLLNPEKIRRLIMGTKEEVNYNPLMDEPYMSEKQMMYFKNKLIIQKAELETKLIAQKEKLKTMKATQPDIIDRTNYLIEMEREIKIQERNSLIIKQINFALERIDDGSFGYCECTGREIGFKRLDVLPFATMSVKAMEKYA